MTKQLGTSGVGQRAPPAAGPSASNVTTPATSDNTQMTPTPMEPPRRTDESTETQDTLKLADNSTTVNEEGGPVLTVPATTGPARVDRGGRRSRGDRCHTAGGAEEEADPQTSQILHAYDGCTGDFGQVVGILRNMQQQQADHYAHMESYMGDIANLTAVHRDILSCLRQVANTMSTPPCVPTTSDASISAPATGSDMDSGGQTPAPLWPAPEGPPSKHGRGHPWK